MVKESNTEWVKLKPEEIDKIVVDLARKGVPPERIGLVLRDQHGIPKAKLLGKKIGHILKAHKISANSEHTNLTNKVENLKKHFGKHKHDYTAQRRIIQHSANIRKIEKLAEI